MNLHALAWLGLFLLFAGMTFRRSSWGIPLYMLTFYALPGRWWWSEGLLSSIGPRWNLAAALIFAAGVFLDRRPKSPEADRFARPVLLLLLIYALNASLVHLLFAVDPERSWIGLEGLWKQVGLCFLLVTAIRDKFDLKLMIYSILLGSAYVGYEVVFNDEGSFNDGRLIVSIGTESGNAAGAMLAMSLALGGYLLFFGNKTEKSLAFISLVLTLEVILRINSRGNLLGLIGGAVWLAFRARGRPRKYAIAGVVLGILAAFAQMGETDQTKVLGRFDTTFAPAEERDSSAQNRIDLWRQGLKMIGDHPLGSGFEAAFESDLGYSYIRDLGFDVQRAVHNGYLDIAASWGVQGLILCLAALALAWRRLRTSSSLAYASGNDQTSFLGWCLEAAVVVQLIASTFGSQLKGEWYFWWVAMALTHVSTLPAAELSHRRNEEAGAQDPYLLEPF